MICPHPGEKTQYIQHTISHQEHNKTHCFCQNPLVRSNHRERRACAEWHEPAAERTAHSRRCKADGLALDLQKPMKPKNPPRGQRPIATINNKNTQTLYQSPKHIRTTRALLCCACLSKVLKLACTHDPPTEQYPSRKIPLPRLAGTTDPRKGNQLEKYKEIRR